ncbi:MAG: type II secretion system protein GspE [Gammaproteobacteria bacterium]|nr:type II secretion system protein GspE [Gammaproteobacteria bacterium]NKB62982.1 type II secretion system protein GspE [Gammaproteobacteria bacterium]
MTISPKDGSLISLATSKPFVEERDWFALSDSNWTNRIPYHFTKHHKAMVVNEKDGVLSVIHSPTISVETVEEIERHFRLRVELYQVEEETFNSVLRRVYDKGQSAATQMVEDLGEEEDFSMLTQELPEIMDLLESVDDAPIIRLINALLTQAIREDASDIHLEAFESSSIVRFRIDGLLRDVVDPQRRLHSALVSRIKVMSKLDIAEKRLPQDGRMSLRVGEKQIDVRVSVLPTQHGERIVLRLLDKQALRFRIDGLGMRSKLAKSFEELIHSPHGIFLVTGPTGSGKTTSLYAGISVLDKDKLNILTIEDPIEYDLDGVGQTQVNSKIDFTFAMGLRSILRQDPDVVLIGEIRDLETAEISVQASLTGHLVLSTLHTNTAIGAVTRLLNMGVEPFLISSSLIGILAQRLVRKLCPNCKQLVEPGGGIGVWEDTGFSNRVFQRHYEPRGCQTCAFTGYRGRTGIYELIIVDDTLRSMIHEKRPEHEMLAHARLTSVGIQESGLELVKAGITSTGELTRVTVQ